MKDYQEDYGHLPLVGKYDAATGHDATYGLVPKTPEQSSRKAALVLLKGELAPSAHIVERVAITGKIPVIDASKPQAIAVHTTGEVHSN